MKKLKDKAYYDLSTRERIIASVEASARGDENEIQKLIKTCPRKNYSSTDFSYSKRMDYLFTMQMAVECDITSKTLDYIFAVLAMMDKDLEKAIYIEEYSIQYITDIYTAWNEFLTDNGINIKTMDKMIDNTRHPYVKNILKRPGEPDRDNIKIFRDILDETFDRNIC